MLEEKLLKWSAIVVVGKYIADFTYDVLGKDTTTFVVEDCKGFRTPVYRAKKRHFERQYGIAILET